nr:BCCT family transporter [Collimonas arenae]
MVLIISLMLVALFVMWGALAPLNLAAVMQTALGGTIANFGWFYLLSMFGFLVFALYLAFGRFGTIRLGGEDAEPDFSRHSWFAMLFAAGMGIGLVFWGVAEPVSHFATPPSGQGGGPEAARLGLRYAFFHWGLHPWAAYCVVALALGFFQFNRNRPMLMSTTFEPCSASMRKGRWAKRLISWRCLLPQSALPLHWVSEHCRSAAACTRYSACRMA